MFQALFRGRQIFKFGLLRKKDNKKNLKIRLVFNRMVRAFFPPYCSYTKTFAAMLRCATHRRERAGGYRRKEAVPGLSFASLRTAEN